MNRCSCCSCARSGCRDTTNGVRFTAFRRGGRAAGRGGLLLLWRGFIVRGDESESTVLAAAVPYPFGSGAELLALCREHGLEIFELTQVNERTWRTDAQIREELLAIWRVMQACVARGFRQTGVLPGVLKVRRRAPKMYRTLTEGSAPQGALVAMDWVNAWALAVNEENAAGGRVVTAPTNGAAGIVPAVLHFYERFEPSASEEGIIRFLLTAGAIGMLYKRNASISGAEMGCQGEVGVACSMAAAGLVAALHGTNEQVENAARSAWSTIWDLPAIRLAGWCRFPASSAMRWARSRPSMPRGWRCGAMARIRCHWTR